jgi:hypothetical protein
VFPYDKDKRFAPMAGDATVEPSQSS